MSTDDTYNGWTNRETWAVALHINNDQGWQESVLEALRTYFADMEFEGYDTRPQRAGDIIRENVEETLSPIELDLTDPFDGVHFNQGQWGAIQDIGSMWRVAWDELGASFLADLDEN